VFALNRSLNEELPLELLGGGFKTLSVKQALQLCDPDLKAINSKDQPDRIAPKPLAAVRTTGEKLSARLPPASWNVIQLAAA
jgi:alpha-N-arabinofuranosidase